MKKTLKRRSSGAKALALPVFRAKVIPNKKRVYELKHKKMSIERDKETSELYFV